MAVAFYMDVHAPGPVTRQLRRRGVDVVTAVEDGTRRAADSELLQRAADLKRVLFTQDIGFRTLAERWQREGRFFAGLIFANQTTSRIGQLVEDLELIAFGTDPDEWRNKVLYLPL
jgi:predicted nuclease of predicted toxin-antitoxin system